MNEVTSNAPSTTQTAPEAQTPATQDSSSDNVPVNDGKQANGKEAVKAPSKKYADSDDTWYKITVDGEEVEVQAKDLKKAYGLDKAAYKKMQEAAHTQKQLQDQVNKFLSGFDPKDPNFRQNLDKFLKGRVKDTGIDIKDVLTEMLVDYAEEESLSPDEKELRHYRQLQKQQKEQEDLYRQQQEQAQKIALQAQVDEEIDLELEAAFKEAGITNPSPYDLAMVADWMLAGIEARGQRLSAKDAVTKLNDYHNRSVDRWVGKSSQEQDDKKFLDSVPKALLERIRKADLALTRAQSQQRPPAQSPKKETASKKSEPKTFDDWWKEKHGN